MAAKQAFKEIIEAQGGLIADRSIELLLHDPELTALKPFTEFTAKNWRDCFSPTLMSLGCQFVGGTQKDTEDLAISISLMNLSFRIWDDIIDETMCRTLRPTFVGKFGKSAALVYGGTVSAKAFTFANEIELDQEKKGKINRLIWNYWAKMARSEIKDSDGKIEGYSAADKLDKIKAETINIQTCLKIGATIGNASKSEIELLENYGLNLGIMLEFLKDLRVSLNLTLELEKKIQRNRLPLLLLLAQEESEQVKEKIEFMRKKGSVSSENLGHLITLILASKSWKHYIDYFERVSGECQTVHTCKNEAAQTLSKIAYIQSKIFGDIIRIEK